MKNRCTISIGIVILAVAALVSTGCYAEKQAGSVKFSGFLDGDYKLLQMGGKDQALYNYVKPGVNVASYTKILLDPVAIWRPADAKGASPKDEQKVANNFYSQLVTHLSKNYEMVKEPGQHTMRVQVALTGFSEGSAAGQVITSVVPIGVAASLVQDFASGKPSFGGEMSVEVKVTDAASGELLGAGVDQRIAAKNIAANTWNELTEITEIWSSMFAYRLCKSRGGTDCFKPKE